MGLKDKVFGMLQDIERSITDEHGTEQVVAHQDSLTLSFPREYRERVLYTIQGFIDNEHDQHHHGLVELWEEIYKAAEQVWPSPRHAIYEEIDNVVTAWGNLIYGADDRLMVQGLDENFGFEGYPEAINECSMELLAQLQHWRDVQLDFAEGNNPAECPECKNWTIEADFRDEGLCEDCEYNRKKKKEQEEEEAKAHALENLPPVAGWEYGNTGGNCMCWIFEPTYTNNGYQYVIGDASGNLGASVSDGYSGFLYGFDFADAEQATEFMKHIASVHGIYNGG
jgi:hypothetical protein